MIEITKFEKSIIEAIETKNLDALTMVLANKDQVARSLTPEDNILAGKIIAEMGRYQKDCWVFDNTYHAVAECIKNFTTGILENQKYSEIKLVILLCAIEEFLGATNSASKVGSAEKDKTFACNITQIIFPYRWFTKLILIKPSLLEKLYSNEKKPDTKDAVPVKQTLQDFFQKEMTNRMQGIDQEIEVKIRNIVDDIINVALFIASNHGFSEGILALLTAGADVNMTYVDTETGSSITPLCNASYCGYTESIKHLLAHPDIKPNETKTLRSETPLYIAARCGHIEIVRLLLTHQAIDPNKPTDEINHHRYAPLHAVCRDGLTEIAKLLLAHPDIDLDQKNKQGQTPRDIASSAGVRNLFNPTIVVEEIKNALKQENSLEQKAKINNAIRRCFNLERISLCKFIREVFLNLGSEDSYEFAKQCFLLNEILNLPNTRTLAELCYDLGSHFYSDNPVLAYLFFDKAKNFSDAEIWEDRCFLSSMRTSTGISGEAPFVDVAVKSPNEYVKTVIKTQLMRLYLLDPQCLLSPGSLESLLHVTVSIDQMNFSVITQTFFTENPQLITTAIMEFIREQILYNLKRGDLINLVTTDDFFCKSTKHQRAIDQWLDKKERDQCAASSRCDDFFSTSVKHQRVAEQWLSKEQSDQSSPHFSAQPL